MVPFRRTKRSPDREEKAITWAVSGALMRGFPRSGNYWLGVGPCIWPAAICARPALCTGNATTPPPHDSAPWAELGRELGRHLAVTPIGGGQFERT